MLMVLLVTALCVVTSVILHCQALLHLSDWLKKQLRRRRYPIVIGVFGALAAHMAEVAIFALGYDFLDDTRYGRLVPLTMDTMESGGVTGASSDYWYYSFVSYTSLGFGDIVPTGALRYMTAVETLTGLVLIAWTASFLYMQMLRIFREDHTLEDSLSSGSHVGSQSAQQKNPQPDRPN
ncbi:MAG: two pore domain potassium channel family protein [Planctomycetota bacterium]|nr:MAG: two pore domain potassium channel family protein [Planctomycetota bacterium]REJ97082.1 MAG: two pore domain potassium channel family protein [Planctomycetota bacterium]REK20567.1 MAG: two pore domain potassium channel family protein [Planctomycetota bacterium]REK35108.1 MAG: two pore domain potassium channel family protein [Planctomycetota bacterium]